MDQFENTVINISFKPTGEFAKNLLLKTFDFLLYNRSQIPFTVDILQNLLCTKTSDNDYKKFSQRNKAQLTYNNILAVKQVISIIFSIVKRY